MCVFVSFSALTMSHTISVLRDEKISVIGHFDILLFVQDLAKINILHEILVLFYSYEFELLGIIKRCSSPYTVLLKYCKNAVP